MKSNILKNMIRQMQKNMNILNQKNFLVLQNQVN